MIILDFFYIKKISTQANYAIIIKVMLFFFIFEVYKSENLN